MSQDEFGQRQVVASIASSQTVDDSLAIALGMVLVELEFADQPLDRHLDADDGAKRCGDVVFGRVADPPRFRLARLVVRGEPFEQIAHPDGIVDKPDVSVRVHHRVIPGRHLASGLALGRVPVRADVSLRAAKYHQRFQAIHAGQLVAARHMRLQYIADQFERQEVGRQPVGGMRHQRRERMVAHQFMQDLASRFPEVPWNVHDPAPQPTSEAMTAFCTCRRFSASSMALQHGASMTSAVAWMPRRNGRQWLKMPPAVSAIFSASTVKWRLASRMGFSSSQRPKYANAPQLLA